MLRPTKMEIPLKCTTTIYESAHIYWCDPCVRALYATLPSRKVSRTAYNRDYTKIRPAVDRLRHLSLKGYITHLKQCCPHYFRRHGSEKILVSEQINYHPV